MPIAEHPFDGSWGLPGHGIFRPDQPFRVPGHGFHGPGRPDAPAPDRRHPRLGPRALSDRRATPSGYFDGTHLYEHADPRLGFHPGLGYTFIFNFGRPEVANFLDRQRPLLGRQVSHRRPPGRRGRLDALPRLFAESRANGSPTSPRRSREPTKPSTLLQAGSTTNSTPPSPARSRSPRSRPRGRMVSRPTERGRASGLTSSGTWAGCTTRSSYFSKKTRSTANMNTTT